MKDAVDSVRLELETTAKTHSLMAAEIKTTLDKPLSEFIISQNNSRKLHQTIVEKSLKTKLNLAASVLKTKEKYELKCIETQELIKAKQAAPSSLPQKELEKLTRNLEKCKSLSNQADFDYLTGVEKLLEVHLKWVDDFTLCCNDFQKLEEDRIDFLRSHLWTYTNIISSTCVTDDEGCERIRVNLEKCEIENDIQLFINKFSSGTEISQPLEYSNYYTKTKKRPSTIDPNTISQYQTSLSKATSQSSLTISPPASNKTSTMPVAQSVTVTPYDAQHGLLNNHDSNFSIIGNNCTSSMSNNEADETIGVYDPFDCEDKIILFTVRILHDYQSERFDEMTVLKGQIVGVTTTLNDGWWEGIGIDSKGKKRKGFFPSNFVETIS